MVGTILRVICYVRYRFRSIPHQHAVARTLDNSGNPPTLYLTRWFQILFITPIWGRFTIWLIFFQMGWNHQPAQEFACGSVYGHSDLSVLCNLYRLTRWFWQGPGVGVFRDRDRVRRVYQWLLSPARPYAAVFLPSSRDVCRRNACEFLGWPSTWFVGRLLVSHAREVSCILGSLDL